MSGAGRSIGALAALALAAGLVLGTPARADFQAGARAFRAGDYGSARAAWEDRARAGEAAAQVALGGLYDGGLGVARDHARAVAWYRLAAEQGDAQGQYELAIQYLPGKGVERDSARALKLLRGAADQGLAEAQYQLGLLLRRGVGGAAPAPAQAAAWHLKAARQGLALAMARLGNMYRDGVGVAQDPVEAYVWYSLAMDGGVGAARLLKKTAAKKLTPEQKAQAEKRTQTRRAEIAKAG